MHLLVLVTSACCTSFKLSIDSTQVHLLDTSMHVKSDGMFDNDNHPLMDGSASGNGHRL